jgi:hypothetical protein
MTALQYMYQTIFTHQSAMSSKITPMQELKQKRVLTWYYVSVRVFLMHLVDSIPHDA